MRINVAILTAALVVSGVGCSSCGDDTADGNSVTPNQSTGGPNSSNNSKNPNGENPNSTNGGTIIGEPAENCEDGHVWGQFGGAISEDITFCGTIAVTDSIMTTSDVAVTILPGTRFIFPQDTSMTLGGGFGGEVEVHAVGTADEPIVFEGTQDLEAHWVGLTLGSTVVPSSEIEHVIVRHAGGTGPFGVGSGAALTVGNTRGLDLVDVTIDKSGGLAFGVVAWGAGTSGLKVVDSVGPLASASTAEAIGNVPPIDTENVEKSYVVVDVTSLSDEVTFRDIGHPYRVSSLDFSADATFEAGAVIEMELNGTLRFRSGVVNVAGEEDAPVLFHGTRPDVAHWAGIHFDNGVSRSSKLVHMDVRHTGSRENWYALSTDATITFQNVTFGDAKMPALQFEPMDYNVLFGDGSSNIVIENDSNNPSAWIGVHALSTIPADSDWGSGGAHIQIGTTHTDTFVTGTVPALNVPIRLHSGEFRTNGGNVEFAEGVVFEFGSGAYFRVRENSTLRVDGVTFKSASGTKGDWGGFRVSSASPASYIRNSTFEDGGSTTRAAVWLEQPFDFTGNTIQNSPGYCIETSSGDTFDYASGDANNTLNCDAGAIKP